MNLTTRAARHSTRLAQQSIAEAGSRTAVARVTGRDRTTVSHECTTRAHPVLAAAFDFLVGLADSDEVTARAFAEAVAEAVELREIITADTDKLLERGLYLLEWENVLDAREDVAALVGTAMHSPALRTWARAASELAQIEDELGLRRIDLHAEFRRRRVS